jgi:hypothetical protein
MKMLKVVCFVLVVLAITAQVVFDVLVVREMRAEKVAVKNELHQKTRDLSIYQNANDNKMRILRCDIQMLRVIIAENKKAEK